MAARRVSKVLARELDVPPDELFTSLNLTHPVGSASISQVLLCQDACVTRCVCFAGMGE